MSKNKMIKAVSTIRGLVSPFPLFFLFFFSFFCSLICRQLNEEVDYDRVMKSGYMDKKKVGAKKWEYRFCLLTLGHLAWFEDYDAREKQKAKGVIDLREVKRVFLQSVDGEGARGEVIHLELESQT